MNVAGLQLEQEGFVEEVACALRDGGLVSSRLMLEVTESSLVGDAEAERLQALRKLGIRLAIDDFGTGYSSLSYLRRFPMDVLKIDRSFTQDACEDGALLQAIVAMGESLGLVLVPEGIESEEQADELRALGCRLGQGFLFGRPVPASELTGIAVSRLEAQSLRRLRAAVPDGQRHGSLAAHRRAERRCVIVNRPFLMDRGLAGAPRAAGHGRGDLRGGGVRRRCL